ncbi:alpha/beta hydrolase [Falsigemmobacter faecalis]|uniref:Alpha/beta hydrolase n=1 Tax=Falsigemmobacter faecalis TaxID=2488730 RepID=A0A3P3D559_9RHOB|nr:alpha/beta hydrolase [Falsigemmobacter faecalis]RRH69271.1 alpha/beta hydrolase [Falsigemmobacter faecalis]
MAVDLYRNRDFIADFDEISAETAARSRALAARVEMRRDLSYGPSGRMRFDLLMPATPRKGAPLHLFLHGGYWRSGRKEDHHLVAAPVLAAGGLAAIVTYDLMPGTRLGTIVSQVRRAAAHILREAPAWGADPARISAGGHSAGAHLAACLAARGPEDPAATVLPALTGLFLMSGIYDLSAIPESFLKSETQMSPQEARAWSPLNAVQLAGPRRYLTHGALETAPFHDQARDFAALLRHAGARVIYAPEPELNHMSIVLALSEPGSRPGTALADLVVG